LPITFKEKKKELLVHEERKKNCWSMKKEEERRIKRQRLAHYRTIASFPGPLSQNYGGLIEMNAFYPWAPVFYFTREVGPGNEANCTRHQTKLFQPSKMAIKTHNGCSTHTTSNQISKDH
jgi:hypothetical protein